MLCEIIYKQNMSVYVDQQVYIHDVNVWWNERHYIPLGIHFHENKYSSGMKIECPYFIDTTSHQNESIDLTNHIRAHEFVVPSQQMDLILCIFISSTYNQFEWAFTVCEAIVSSSEKKLMWMRVLSVCSIYSIY